jgi:DNA-binding CsgD family transcriptional regulator
MKVLCCFAVIILLLAKAAAQPVDEARLQQMVSNKNKEVYGINDSVFIITHHYSDSATRVKWFHFFDSQNSSADLHTSARSLAWNAVVLSKPPFNKPDVSDLMLQAIVKAVQSSDDYLLVSCLENYAYYCRENNKPEIALFYFLKAAELRTRLNDRYIFFKNKTAYGVVGETLYNMQEYKQAIDYLKLSASLPVQHKRQHTSFLNTLALCYQRLQQYDSALYWYSESLASAKKFNDSTWQGIVNGNIGAVYFEQKQDKKALPLLWYDYNKTINTEPNSAGNTLHRIALIYLRQNKTDSALLLARRSLQMVSYYSPANKNYIRNAYRAIGEIYRHRKNTDSAFYYADIYHRLNDSINQAVARNRTDVVQTRLEFEKTTGNINTLLREKQTEKTWRYILIALLLLTAAAAWFYIRWQRQQNINRQQKLLHAKQMAEAEANNAREQLNTFTQSIISKNDLIERLQLQLHQQNTNLHEDLFNQSILTENDWLRFRDMFEKANPWFIKKLQQLAPDITTAELRLAALLKLNMGNKHIASILGVSTDAVRKTKSRLRQRLQITVDDDLEDFIRSIKSH